MYKNIILILLILSVFSSCAKKEKADMNTSSDYREDIWKVGHVRPEGTSTDTDLKAFASNLSENTEGKIVLEIYPASQLGNYSVVQERVGIGDVEMQLAPFGTNINKGLGIASASYIASNWKEVFEVYDPNGPLVNKVREIVATENIHILALYPKYFGGIALSKLPENIEDPLADKGIKIRVPGLKQYELIGELLGFISTPIPFSEAFTAMQTGVVDGAIGSGAEGYYASFRDVTKYFLVVNDHFEMWFLYMNKDLYDSLNDVERAALDKAAMEFEKDRYAQAEGEEEFYISKLEEEGIEIIRYSDEALARVKERNKTEIWPQLKDILGTDVYNLMVDIAK